VSIFFRFPMVDGRGPILVGDVVAVTGASGYIGSHVCKCLLDRGFKVRAVVRNKDDPTKVGHLQATAVGLPEGALSFHTGDLAAPGSYDAAFEGADAVIHTAAVVEVSLGVGTTVDEAWVVAPSVDGTRNVLASLDRSSTVKRLVHTSSVAAILNADRSDGTTFTEADWNGYSAVGNGDPYGYAKTQAEKLVHEHFQRGQPYDFAVINPGVVLGPCLTKAHTKASVAVIRQMLYGNEQPSYFAPLVDVRDVAQAHVEALLRPEAAGKRFILVEHPSRWLLDLGDILVRQFPDYDIRPQGLAWYKQMVAPLLCWLGMGVTPFQANMATKRFNFDSSQATAVLGLKFRDIEETVRDSAESMLATGWVKIPKKPA